MTGPMLEVMEVQKHYGSFQALAGVQFTVQEGEIFGLLGPNGAGKTTLISILSGLSWPSAGEVRLLGHRVGPTSMEARQLIGIVPQDLAVYETLTARENLEFFGELFDLRGAELRRRANGLLEAVGLESRANDRVATFSGGMKRRLNLAIALMHAPRLLLLDEPTVGVDPQSRNLIFEEVRRLNATGMTVVYTSHYMEEVEALCPRIGIMDKGRIQACDTLPRLLQMLSGLIRCRVSEVKPLLRERLEAFENCKVRESGPNEIDLECHDVKGTLLRLIGVLNETQVDLVHLESQEPNLERVFLHLTGRALRD